MLTKEWVSNVIDSNACKHYSKPAVRGKPAAEVGWQHYTTLSEYDLERVAERITQAAEEEMATLQQRVAELEERWLEDKVISSIDYNMVLKMPEPRRRKMMMVSDVLFDGLRQENERLRAQVAVMAGLLSRIEWIPTLSEDFGNPDDEGSFVECCPICEEVKIIGHTEDCELARALSAAPKVALTGSAQYGVNMFNDPVLYLDDNPQTERLEGSGQYEVIMLECPRCHDQGQENEQGYKRARGVIPWHEGDEPPEDTIARIRGRAREEDDGNQ